LQNLSSHDCIIQNFIPIFEKLRKDNLIESEQICDCDKAVKINLHSLLQFALIKSGIECGFMAIPEFKVSTTSEIFKLSEPMSKSELGVPVRKNDAQATIKHDVAFFPDSKIKGLGLGEVITLDEINHCLTSKDIQWVATSDKLRHVLKKSSKPIDFMILVNVFPKKPVLFKKGKHKGYPKLHWGQQNRTIDEWEKLWKEFTDELNADGTDARLVCISEKGVDPYPAIGS
jgi:hypothetical protein